MGNKQEELDLLGVYGDMSDDEILELTDEDIGVIDSLEQKHGTPSRPSHSDDKREQIRKMGMDGVRNLYKGDFDTLIENQDRLPNKLERINEAISNEGRATPRMAKLLSVKKQLESAQDLLEAYQGIESASTDEAFDDLLQGKVPVGRHRRPEGWSEEDERLLRGQSQSEQDNYRHTVEPQTNRYIQRIMPDVDYKVNELQGESPSLMEGIFPEASRRADADASNWGIGFGGLKDVTRLAGRGLRPLASQMAGKGSPVLNYWEQFAKPDKYKGGAEEFFDEAILPVNLLGGTVSKGVSAVGSKLPRVKGMVNRAFPFRDASGAIHGALNPDLVTRVPLANQLGYSLAKNTPEIIGDVGYEMTRGSDEESSPIGALLGGVLGSGAVPLLRRGKDIIADGVISPLGRQMDRGSKKYLRENLATDKAMLDPIDRTSLGGFSDIERARTALSDRATDISKSRDYATRQLDDALSGEYRDIMTDPAFGKTIISPRDITPVGSEALTAMRDLPENYLGKLADLHPSQQDKVARELARTTGVTIPTESDLLERARLFQKVNNRKITPEDLKALESTLGSTQGIAEKYKVIQDFEGSISNPKKVISGTQEPASIGKAIDSRTQMRKYADRAGENTSEKGYSKADFEQAERVQKDVMSDYLDKSFLGKKIREDYSKIARLHELKRELPKIKPNDRRGNAKRTETWLNDIGNSAMTPEKKAGLYQSMIDIQKDINESLGNKVGSKEYIDFSSNAVLRAITDEGVLSSLLGSKRALASKVASKLKSKGWKVLTGPVNLRQLIAQTAKEVEREGTPEKTRANISLSGDSDYVENKWDKQWSDLMKAQSTQGRKLPPLAP
jgi:hypothetical protein